MTDWNIYGNVIRVYKGSGNLHSGELEISCNFELVQLAKGDLYASCLVLDTFNAVKTSFMLFNKQPDKLLGKTDDGKHIFFSENLITVSNHDGPIIVRGKFVEVKSSERQQPFCIKFALTNLVTSPDQIELNCDGCNVIIKRGLDINIKRP